MSYFYAIIPSNMPKEKKQLKKESKKERKITFNDLFESACDTLKRNWRCSLELFLVFLSLLIFFLGINYAAISYLSNFWLKFFIIISSWLIFAMFIIGKNKNSLMITKDMGGEHYPLWRISYLVQAWRLINLKIILWGPMVLSLGLSLFFWLISPSAFWLALCLILGFVATAYLQIRFGLAELAISVDPHLKIADSLQISARVSDPYRLEIFSLWFLHLLVAGATAIFLPIIGWSLVLLVVSFEKALFYQKTVLNK